MRNKFNSYLSDESRFPDERLRRVYARIVKTSINARSAIRWRENEKTAMYRRMHLRYESAGLRAMRVHIIILGAGYTYLHIREGFACARVHFSRYPPRYLYGLLQRFRQLRDERGERGRGGSTIARPLRAFRCSIRFSFEVHNCFNITAYERDARLNM